jgi:hypothetical protein
MIVWDEYLNTSYVSIFLLLFAITDIAILKYLKSRKASLILITISFVLYVPIAKSLNHYVLKLKLNSNNQVPFLENIRKEIKCEKHVDAISSEYNLKKLLAQSMATSKDWFFFMNNIADQVYSNNNYCKKVLVDGPFNEYFLDKNTMSDNEMTLFKYRLIKDSNHKCKYNNFSFLKKEYIYNQSKSFKSILSLRFRWVASENNNNLFKKILNNENIKEEDLCEIAKEVLSSFKVLSNQEGKEYFSLFMSQEVFKK